MFGFESCLNINYDATFYESVYSKCTGPECACVFKIGWILVFTCLPKLLYVAHESHGKVLFIKDQLPAMGTKHIPKQPKQ